MFRAGASPVLGSKLTWPAGIFLAFSGLCLDAGWASLVVCLLPSSGSRCEDVQCFLKWEILHIHGMLVVLRYARAEPLFLETGWMNH